jgi:hypothetical protein
VTPADNAPNPAELPQPDISANDSKDLLEFKKLRYQAELDIYKANHAASIALAKAEEAKAFWQNEYTQAQAVQAAYLDVGKGALDRAAARAEFVQKAAAAVSTAYAGILALTYTATSTATSRNVLPVRGLVPAFFLGLSIALVAAYLSFLTKVGQTVQAPETGIVPFDQLQRRNDFLEWTRRPTQKRLYALQVAILSLALGALLLPLPFLNMADKTALIIGGVGLLFILLIPGIPGIARRARGR